MIQPEAGDVLAPTIIEGQVSKSEFKLLSAAVTDWHWCDWCNIRVPKGAYIAIWENGAGRHFCNHDCMKRYNDNGKQGRWEVSGYCG